MSKCDTNISLSQNKSRIYQSASPPFFLLKNEGEAVKENYSHTHKPL